MRLLRGFVATLAIGGLSVGLTFWFLAVAAGGMP